MKAAVERAREQVAELLGAASPVRSFSPRAVQSQTTGPSADFSSRTLRGVTSLPRASNMKRCVTSANISAQIGCEVTWLEVNENGELNLDDLRQALRRDTGIVSVMMANNETGVLFPIKEIGKIVRENSDAVFHVDGVQAVGKIPISLKELEVDLFALSGHKLHAPQGVGALYIREGVKLPPFIIGGAQERGRRARHALRSRILSGSGAACELASSL